MTAARGGGSRDHWIHRRQRDVRSGVPPTPFLPRLPLVVGETVLRRLHPDDLDRFQAYRADPGTARFQGWAPMWRADALRFLRRESAHDALCPGRWVQLAVCRTDATELIGDIGLFLDDDGQESEIGFTLAPAARGRGHATRAVLGAVDLVFATSEAHCVRARADTRNTASRGVLERAGFHLQRSRRLRRLRGGDVTELRFVRERE